MSKKATFTPKQFQMEGARVKGKLQKIFEGTQTVWHKFLMPAINAITPIIGIALAAKSKNPEVGEASKKFSKSIRGGKNLRLTEMHGNRLRLNVM